MTARKDDAEVDAAAVGRAIYEKLRARLEAEEWGRVVVIDVKSGDYEIAGKPSGRRPAPAGTAAGRLYLGGTGRISHSNPSGRRIPSRQSFMIRGRVEENADGRLEG